MIPVPNIVNSSHKTDVPEFIPRILMFSGVSMSNSSVSSRQKENYLKKYMHLLFLAAEVHEQKNKVCSFSWYINPR